MSDVSLDELGPVDYLIVEFPAGAQNFTGEMVTELIALVDAGAIRVVDVIVVAKGHDGTIDVMELSDFNDLGALARLEAEFADFLAEDDVAHLAETIAPGSVAGVMIWENLWAVPFAAAVRHSGGQLVATGRVPIQAIIAAIEADEATEAIATEGA